MKTIIVTGGAGYIGSHTCKKLYEEGFNPIVYDNLSTGHKEFVKWGDLIVGDLHDTSKLKNLLKKTNPVAVIHFAASAYVGESVENPFKYYQNNVGGTLSLVEAMRLSNVDKIVFSSTCATYGIPNMQQIDEAVPQKPINPYGRSKLIIEQILKDLSDRNEINYFFLRYFNAAGADKDGEIGEWHDPETHLIPLAIESAFNGPRLKIFGSDFPTHDGYAVRDYVHVEDLADAHVASLRYLLDSGLSDAVNLGTGQGSSVFEIVRALEELGLKINYEVTERRKGDPPFLVSNPLKVEKILHWKPKYSNIKDILNSAVNWHRKNN